MPKNHIEECLICSSSDFLEIKTFVKISYKKCLNCNFHYQNKPIKIDYVSKNSLKFKDKFGEKRNFLKKNEIEKRVKNWFGGISDYINNLQNNKKLKILDFGSGPGYLLSSIHNHQKYSYELNLNSQKYLKKNIKDVIILKSPFKKKYQRYFDIIILYHVIEHVDKPIELIRKLKNLLKKGGVIIIGTPNVDSLGYLIFRGNFRLFDREHLFMFGEKSIRILLKRLNLKIIKTEFPFFKTDYFNLKNLFLMLLVWKISPPFYKNVMTHYCRK